MKKENEELYKVVITGLMAALCYVAFTFLKIPIPTFGGDIVAASYRKCFLCAGSTFAGRFLWRACRSTWNDHC